MSEPRESPALRHAILRVQPDYFFWNPQEQEKYRVNIPREDDFTINQHLFLKLFNITVHTQEQLRVEWDNLNMAQLLILNENRLPLQGVGDDLFFLNDVLMCHFQNYVAVIIRIRVPDSNQEILAVKKKLEGTNPIPSPKFLSFIVAHNELMRLRFLRRKDERHSLGVSRL